MTTSFSPWKSHGPFSQIWIYLRSHFICNILETEVIQGHSLFHNHFWESSGKKKIYFWSGVFLQIDKAQNISTRVVIFFFTENIEQHWIEMLCCKNQNLRGLCSGYCYRANFVQIQNNDSTYVYFTFNFYICLGSLRWRHLIYPHCNIYLWDSQLY